QAADSDIESVRIKLAYDLWYVENRSLGLDLRILLATAFLLVGTSFDQLRWLFRFPTRQTVEAAYLAGLVLEPQRVKPTFVSHASALPMEQKLGPTAPQLVLLNIPECV